MIALLSGNLLEKEFARIVVDVNGVGFELQVPMSTYDKLPRPGEKVVLRTILHVREDALVLFGFYTSEEKDLFQTLVQVVSGVGPKLALSILGSLSPASFCGAIRSGDVRRLSQISGIGKRTAERLVVELKDKLDHIVPAIGAAAALPGGDDAVAALVTLGFRQDAARKAVATLLAEGPRPTDELIRKALPLLNR